MLQHVVLQHVVLQCISRDEKICPLSTRELNASKGQAILANLVIFAFHLVYHVYLH